MPTNGKDSASFNLIIILIMDKMCFAFLSTVCFFT